MGRLGFPLFIFLLLAATLAGFAQSDKPKPKAKPAPKLSAEQLEAKALKCLTAQEAFDLYESEMPQMTESERVRSQLRRRYWAKQAQEGARRLGQKWLKPKEIAELNARAAPLAAAAARKYETSVPEAVVLLERALEIHAEHLPSLFVMGSVYGYDQKFDSAKTYFERCVEIDADHFPSMHNLAVCEDRIGDFESALRHLEICVRLNREDPALAATITGFIHDLEGAAPPDKRTRKQKQLIEEAKPLMKSIPAAAARSDAPPQPKLISISDSAVLPVDSGKGTARTK